MPREYLRALSFALLLAALAIAPGVSARPRQRAMPRCTAFRDPFEVNKAITDAWSIRAVQHREPEPKALDQLASCAAQYCSTPYPIWRLYQELPSAPVFEESFSCLDIACKSSSRTAACGIVASLRLKRGTEDDLRQAEAYFRPLCEKQIEDCAGLLDVMAARKRLSPEERTLAQGCVSSTRASPVDAGHCHEFTQKVLERKDPQRVEELLHWGCHGLVTGLCTAWSEWLARTGHEPEALETLAVTCSRYNKSDACDALLDRISHGTQPYAPSFARYLALHYCSGPICERQKKLFEALQPEETQRSCLAGGGASCTAAGLLREAADADGEPERARAWFRRGCEHGDAGGCFFLAAYVKPGQSSEINFVRHWWKKGCDDGFPPACTALAEHLDSGPQAAGAPSKYTLCSQSCHAGDPEGCACSSAWLPTVSLSSAAIAGRR